MEFIMGGRINPDEGYLIILATPDVRLSVDLTVKEPLFNSSLRGAERRGNLMQWNQSVRDCRVAPLLLMNNRRHSGFRRNDGGCSSPIYDCAAG